MKSWAHQISLTTIEPFCSQVWNNGVRVSLGRKIESQSLALRWLEGEHPQEEGQTVETEAFFDFDNNPKYKSVPVSQKSFKDDLNQG